MITKTKNTEKKVNSIIYKNDCKINPVFKKDYICLVLCSNNDFLKYASVMISSIIANSEEKHNYDIIILHKAISYENMCLLNNEVKCRNNFSLRFVNVKNLIRKDNYYIKSHYQEVTEESYYRLYIPEVLSEKYQRAVYLDGDMVSMVDLYKLNKIKIDNYYLAATRDYLGIAESYRNDSKGEKRKQYQLTKVKLKNLDDYFIAGLLIMNLVELRKQFNIEIIDKLVFKEKWNLYDQDVLNYMCRGNMAMYLDARWNVLCDYGENKYLPDKLKNEYFESEKDPYIIHYGGPKKPWKGRVTREEYFWQYASKSPFYQHILINVLLFLVNKEETIDRASHILLDKTYHSIKEIKNIEDILNCIEETNIKPVDTEKTTVKHSNGTERNDLQMYALLIEYKIKIFKEYQNKMEDKLKTQYLLNFYDDVKKYRNVLIVKPLHFYKKKDEVKKISKLLFDVSNKICKNKIIGHIGIYEYKLITKGNYYSWLISLAPYFYYKTKEIILPRK